MINPTVDLIIFIVFVLGLLVYLYLKPLYCPYCGVMVVVEGKYTQRGTHYVMWATCPNCKMMAAPSRCRYHLFW